jgi:hypothetical protein
MLKTAVFPELAAGMAAYCKTGCGTSWPDGEVDECWRISVMR